MRKPAFTIASALAACLALSSVTFSTTGAREPTHIEAMAVNISALIWDYSSSEFRQVPARPASMQQPEQPLDITPAPTTFNAPEQPLDTGLSGSQRYSFDFQPQAEDAPSFSNVFSGGVTTRSASVDAIAGLQQSNDSDLVAQQRSPISLDPHIRGYRIGQITTTADGAFYFPVRNDLDTVLSKIDPSLIKSVAIVPGPYNLRYGPGFAYLDVQTVDTPRYNNGYETHGRTGFDYRTNGGQVYGRETIWGGSSDWGFIFSYGNRNGGDYRAGNNIPIPASYAAQNFSLQLGFDLSPDSKLEIRGARIDQTNTEYALQFFDIDFIGTDALTLNYTNDAPIIGDRMRADAWWNNSRFNGNTADSGKQTFGPINRVDAALNAGIPGASLFGATSGDYMSTGARETLTFGDQQEGEAQVEVGLDGRVFMQSTIENFTIFNGVAPGVSSFITTNQPQSTMVDAGAFIDVALPWLPYFTSTLGYRCDYVQTDAQASELFAPTTLPGAPGSLAQTDVLHTFYLLNDLQITDVWSTRFGGGYAQRVPTLTDRYADGIFLGIIQSGLTRVTGDPNLNKESLIQADFGLKADYDVARLEANLFYSWIDNYITYQAQPFNDPTGARILSNVNTAQATLAGMNAKVEADWTSQFTTYGTLLYVKGDDVTLAQPLAQIYPLDSRAGVRLKSDDEGATWGLDLGLRMVASQNRPANFRTIGGGPLTQVEQRTGGFTLGYVRGYYNVSQNLHFVGGVENLFNRLYLEHLSLRLPAQAVGGIPPTDVFSPGITPYVGIEWTF